MMFTRKKRRRNKGWVGMLVLFMICIAYQYTNPERPTTIIAEEYELENIPEYNGNPICVLNGNIPNFSEADKTTEEFEAYSDMDELGRCGVAYANISTKTLPSEEREGIGHIRPAGWQTVKYDFIDGKYVYNRCHLIAFCLAGENANEKNLITGTRYMNVEGMLPYETEVVRYVEKTNNHVLYRVTPIYNGNELVARGVQIEAFSVEDNGRGISFNVYCYNVQPGVIINYNTGEVQKEE